MIAPSRQIEVLLAQRLLERASFGPRPGDLESLMGLGGPEAWLDRQLEPRRIDDAEAERRLQHLPSLRLRLHELTRGADMDDPQMAGQETRERARKIGRDAAGARVIRAVYGRRELEEVMIDLWANHFTVSLQKRPVGALVPHYEREVLRPHALGRFDDLLMATAKSPAMLLYLDNWRSSAPRERVRSKPPRRGGINENYARELLELHTLGVDGGYTQNDVIEVARVFTGWTLQNREHPRFTFRPALHDAEPKRVLGLPLREHGIEEGEELLRRLARHPATARRVCHRLALRFVSDVPPQPLTDRLVRVYHDSDGSIRAVLSSLFAAPEFLDPDERKLKTPLELFASALRATGGETDGDRPTLMLLARLGESPWLARSPAGFPDTVVDWADPGAMLRRIELPFLLARGRPRGSRLGNSPPRKLGFAGGRAGVDRREETAVALGLLPPVGDANHAKLRGELAIERRDALPFASGFGLHPALAPLAPLVESGELAAPAAVRAGGRLASRSRLRLTCCWRSTRAVSASRRIWPSPWRSWWRACASGEAFGSSA